MKPWLRYSICILLGLGAGSAFAISQVRGGMADGQISNGAWTTAKTYGSVDASALTRAKVALTGLLALPAKEAIYFNAKVDSDGKPLDGRCTYEVAGGEFAARWWSITLYRGQGWLVKNPINRWSVNGGSLPMNESNPPTWTFRIAPSGSAEDLQYLPSGGVAAFDLTLRLYHPSPALLANPEKATLPTITKKGCK